MIHPKKKLISVILAAALYFLGQQPCLAAVALTVSQNDILDTAKGIIEWKKESLNLKESHSLPDDGLAKFAATAAGDWYVLAAARFNGKLISKNSVYKSTLISAAYDLSKRSGDAGVNATDIYRAALTLAALGGNPWKTGGNDAGFLDDFTSSGNLDYIKRQGVGGLIWGLIAYDSTGEESPENAGLTRQDFITQILMQQCTDGGFALAGAYSDTDMTAMAIQALAPYQNSSKVYSYKRVSDNAKMTKTVYEIISESLNRLSNLQRDSGDFKSLWVPSAESTAQVIIALCSLGIDPEKDARFIKGKNSSVDGLMLYRTEKGGFSHTLPAINPDSKASEQSLCSLAALWRYKEGLRNFYDMRCEQDAALKNTIFSLTHEIDKITGKESKAYLDKLFGRYKDIPAGEHMYVYSFQRLNAALNIKTTFSSSAASRETGMSKPIEKNISDMSGISSGDKALKILSKTDSSIQDKADVSKAVTPYNTQKHPFAFKGIYIIIAAITAAAIIIVCFYAVKNAKIKAQKNKK